ncbi:hypothetical protein JCM10213_000433 [Rhodosporidiobolus nylandii]
MAPPVAAACWVCGLPAPYRCPKCAKKGVHISFCSREHQKMVWPAHKVVCGSKSNPFLFPPLSREEAKEAKDNMWTTYTDGPLVTASLAKRFEGVYNKSDPAWIPKIADNLTHPPRNDYTKPLNQDILANFRSSETFRTILMRSSVADPVPPNFRTYPLQLCSIIAASVFYRQPGETQGIPLWQSTLFHKVIVSTTLAILAGDYSDNRELEAYHRYALQQTMRWIEAEVRKRKPEEAQQTLDILLSYGDGVLRPRMDPGCVVM